MKSTPTKPFFSPMTKYWLSFHLCKYFHFFLNFLPFCAVVPWISCWREKLLFSILSPNFFYELYKFLPTSHEKATHTFVIRTNQKGGYGDKYIYSVHGKGVQLPPIVSWHGWQPHQKYNYNSQRLEWPIHFKRCRPTSISFVELYLSCLMQKMDLTWSRWLMRERVIGISNWYLEAFS